jgi:GH43 family beta-xylosidase
MKTYCKHEGLKMKTRIWLVVIITIVIIVGGVILISGKPEDELMDDIKTASNEEVNGSIKSINIVASVNKMPTLPSKAEVESKDGSVIQANVVWDDIDADKLKQPGEFTVEGTAIINAYTNPLIEQRADPYIYKHSDGYYYFTASVPEYDRLILRRSNTIQGLADADEVVIWEKHDQGEMSVHIWAPELHYINSKWYMYFAAGGLGGDIWGIRPYVLEGVGDNPLSATWTEKGMMQKEPSNKESFTNFSLDATTFEHNGMRYFVWAQKTREPFSPSNLYIAQMINAWTIKGQQVLISSPEYDWERRGFWVNEGAAVIKRNGKIFMTFSASATNSNYCMGLLTALDDRDLLLSNSWVKNSEPVLISNVETSQYGPGHNSFTVAEDGITDILVYHARSYKEIAGDPLYDQNRQTRVKILTWNEDGSPNFGELPADGLTPGEKIKVVAQITVK